MTVQLIERNPRPDSRTRLRRMLSAPGRKETEQMLPLRMELFLIAHADQTGDAHISETALSRGLTGATLFELLLADKVLIGWRFDVRAGRYTAERDVIILQNSDATGDPLLDNAISILWDMGSQARVTDFVKRFATTDLCERVRADMVVTGVLRRTTRRRFRLFRRDTYLAVDHRTPIRVRTRLRDNITDQADNPGEQPDYRTLAQAALVAALGLAGRLAPSDSTGLRHRINHLVSSRPDPAIRDVAAAVSPRRHRTFPPV
ncbi:MAG TPA: GPP34 family phosphoprotein [Micromonosporaceae bacterium]